MFAVRDTSAERVIAGWQVRDAGGTPRTIQLGQIRDATGALQIFYNPMVVNASPVELATTKGSMTWPCLVQSLPTTITPVGGHPPYTYTWTLKSGTALTLTAPGTASTAFNYNFSAENTLHSTYTCVVHDSLGGTGSVDVPVTLVAVDYR
jgi:hypothetical protein